MGFFDKLKIAERLEAMAGDAGKSVKTALTPKAPFPLSVAGLKDTASKKLDTTVSTTADTAEKKMRSKASTLQDNTVGKVTTAVEGRVTSEVGRVEKKVDDEVAAVEKKVDDTIDGVGKTVDGGIASANKSLDTALGRSPAEDEEKDAVVAAPATKDGVAAPLASGFQKATPAGRSRGNAVIGAGRKKPNDAEVVDAEETKTDGPEVAPTDDFDEFNNSDSGVDVEGDAVAAARERKREAQAEAEAEGKDDGEDMGLASLFGEETEDTDEGEVGEVDDDTGELDDEVDAKDPSAAPADGGETTNLDPEAEMEQITAEHEGADGLAAKVRALKEKLAVIDNETKALLGGSLATSKSSKNPWLAFFAANGKFKKKKAVRDFKNELEGKTEDEQEKKDIDEAKGAAKLETEEVSIKAGKLHRSEKSPERKGEVVDTTGKKTGSKDGRQVFAVSKDNKIYMPYAHKDGDQDMLSDSQILLDGEMRVKDGKITYLSNEASGEQESRPEFLDFLQTLRDAGVGNFDVFEASKKEEAKSSDLLEEADKADEGTEVEPEPEQAKLLDVMAKSDEWKALIADRTEKLVLAVAEQEGWKVAGDAIVDATGAAVDIELARTTVDKSRSKLLAEMAAKEVAKRAGKGAAATADA